MKAWVVGLLGGLVIMGCSTPVYSLQGYAMKCGEITRDAGNNFLQLERRLERMDVPVEVANWHKWKVERVKAINEGRDGDFVEIVDLLGFKEKELLWTTQQVLRHYGCLVKED